MIPLQLSQTHKIYKTFTSCYLKRHLILCCIKYPVYLFVCSLFNGTFYLKGRKEHVQPDVQSTRTKNTKLVITLFVS